MKKLPVLLVCLFTLLSLSPALAESSGPNILWIVAEDTSPWMGCYGHEANAEATPNIDAMASAGVLFHRAYVPAPVCSACRSSLMGGQSQIRFGAHEHRSSRGPAKIDLPEGLKLLPQIMMDNGYYTANLGKTDYNFIWDQDVTYGPKPPKNARDPWDELKARQPFFVQIQIKGGKNNTSKFPAERKTDPADVTVPGDYPQDQLHQEIVAEHCDSIRLDDDIIGGLLAGLDASGMADNTVVAYFSDHGANHLLRHKQMVTEGGLHVPFMVKGPERLVPSNVVRNDLVSMLDLCATTLAWAGIEIPSWYEGRDLFADDFTPRSFVASAKDRMDATIDRCRSVRTERFRYTRNYMLDRIFLQPQYRDKQEYTRSFRKAYAEGTLPAKLTEIYFGERPAEELYDVAEDPSQLNNLAGDPDYLAVLQGHRDILDGWLAKGDTGAGDEPIEALKTNGEGKSWGDGVNPEYEVYRTDSDGDGLSDTWEKTNGRDPSDGRLLFEFDCGGWQTEGWRSDGIAENIAGRLGYLDFTLSGPSAVLVRDGLKTAVTRRDKSLDIVLRCSERLSIQASLGDEALGNAQSVETSDDRVTVSIPLKDEKAWQETVESLKLKLTGKPGTFVEIDSIAVQR